MKKALPKISLILSVIIHLWIFLAIALSEGSPNGHKSGRSHGTGSVAKNKFDGVAVKNIISKDKNVEISIINKSLVKAGPTIKKLKPKKPKKKSVKKCPGKWFGGIGIEEVFGTIETVFPGYPADLAGLQVGDEIVHANQPQIIGTPGTVVILTIKRNGDLIEIPVTRGEICY